ncbi:response regulator [Caminibacter mediatlanticus TB-2]|uniref:Chemotaxis protein n=1 Tax=Caminibacter mediatlanticus TB-2 TaxID=391592 RepID=A0AAI9AGV9_9BACT|nr:response regulator [Caminibacter mediatlanticus]EDM23386.1 chemotaxis protein [Caminibacter mediatlanticus TB-2]QCT93698.1 response regulator [Caminibacter mediatlanticus TB-2]
MKVLIVDDAMTMRKIIGNVLKQLGFKPEDLIEATDGEDAWEKLQKYKDEVKIIFLDWNMPKMDGYEFLTLVRKHPEFNDVKIIMTTTETAKPKVIKALKAGANNYIAKPFSPQTLKEKLQKLNIQV